MMPTDRPQPWYGPDDFCEGDNIAFEIARRAAFIAAWDAEKAKRLAEMNWLHRLRVWLTVDADAMP